MKRGQVTFLIIPGGEHKVRELKLSASFIVLIFCLFLGGLAATAFLASEYREHRKNLGILAELEEKNRVQEEDLLLLMDKVARFEERIARLNDFERKIRIISNLDVSEEDGSLFGVGGSASEEESTESRLEAAGRSLIDEMHRDVDILLQESSARERSFRELVEYLKTQKSELARTPSIWPVIGWVTSEFGNRKSLPGKESIITVSTSPPGTERISSLRPMVWYRKSSKTGSWGNLSGSTMVTESRLSMDTSMNSR